MEKKITKKPEGFFIIFSFLKQQQRLKRLFQGFVWS